MAHETTADTAIHLASYLQSVRTRIKESGEVEQENKFATGLFVIALAVETAILNGKIPEIAESCYDFVVKHSGAELPQGLRLRFRDPAPPSDN